MPGRKFRVVAILGATLITSALVANPAGAQTIDPDDTIVNVLGGVLQLTDDAAGTVEVSDFADANITGAAQVTTATMDDLVVSDLRGGLGAGWVLTAQATRFQEGQVCVGGVCTAVDTNLDLAASQLPVGSLDLAAPGLAAAAGNPSTSPPSLNAGPYTLDAGSAVEISEAAVGTGTGAWDFTNADGSLSLDLPADVVPATYKSTVTMTLSAAPVLP